MDLKEKSIEKLEQKLKELKLITGILIGLLIVLFIGSFFGLFFIIDKSAVSTVLIVIPIALSAILPLNFINMKKIKSEIESRK